MRLHPLGVLRLTESTNDGHFNHAGIAVTASSGDNGFGVEYPAATPFVTAVGGTTLTPATNTRGFVETAWSGGEWMLGVGTEALVAA